MSFAIFSPIVTTRVVFILGIVNFLMLLCLFLTCRCLPTSRLGKGLLQKKFYKAIYKYHCYLWYVLVISVVAHIIFAISISGFPF